MKVEKKIKNIPSAVSSAKQELNENSKDTKVSEIEQSSIKHDFTPKVHFSTFISIVKCVTTFAIAIPTFGFHASIAAILCLILKITPLSTPVKRRLQRNIKSYGGHIVNTVASLWFSKTFYISIDNKFLDLIRDSNEQGKYPRVLTISNHVSDVDWIYISFLAETLKFFRYTYIIMKHEISTWPVLGFFTRNFGHSFVGNRNRTVLQKKTDDLLVVKSFSKGLLDDIKRKNSSEYFSWFIEKISEFLADLKFIPKSPGANGLFFPEATTFTKSRYESTLKFHETSIETASECPDIFYPEYVLLPKPLGTAVILSQLAENLDGICDVTMLSFPFVSSNSDCHSFLDIFLCRSTAFSFCIKLDLLEIPTDLKESIKKLPESDLNFEQPSQLSTEEKEVKSKTLSFLNKMFKRKNDLIKSYVEGESQGDFKDISEFKKFIELNCDSATSSTRKTIATKLGSPYKMQLILTSFIFIFILYKLLLKN